MDQQIIDQAKLASRTFQSFIDIIGELEKVGSIDGAVNEANARLDAIRTGTEAAIEQRVMAMNELADMEQKVADRQKDADALLIDARQQAADLIAAAESKATEVMQGAAQGVQEAKAAKDLILSEAMELEASINLKRAALEELEQKITQAKARVAAILEG